MGLFLRAIRNAPRTGPVYPAHQVETSSLARTLGPGPPRPNYLVKSRPLDVACEEAWERIYKVVPALGPIPAGNRAARYVRGPA